MCVCVCVYNSNCKCVYIYVYIYNLHACMAQGVGVRVWVYACIYIYRYVYVALLGVEGGELHSSPLALSNKKELGIRWNDTRARFVQNWLDTFDKVRNQPTWCIL